MIEISDFCQYFARFVDKVMSVFGIDHSWSSDNLFKKEKTRNNTFLS